MTTQNKRGRPRNPQHTELQAKRRFLPLEKSPSFLALLELCHTVYQERHGHDSTDAEVIRETMRAYIG